LLLWVDESSGNGAVGLASRPTADYSALLPSRSVDQLATTCS
jgi:hypothetical protein